MAAKYLLVAGARPNFVKIAPVYRAFRSRQGQHSQGRLLLVHTGQHYSPTLSDSLFHDLDLPAPDIQLDVASGSHAEQTARIMLGFERVCLEQRPDWVIVAGDVNSTLACALTAKKLGVRLAHVESGLRSGDMSMPEEINRRCTDAVSDLLFATERSAVENLRQENVAPEKIHFTGNTMIDSLFRHLPQARRLPLPERLRPREYAVLTLHRPSNVDSLASLAPLVDTINALAQRIPIVFPMHPRTASRISAFHLHPAVLAMPPMGYLVFLGLIDRSRLVLTDSGGIQEETTVLQIPCLTLRSNTERPVTCEIGTNRLIGTDPRRIVQAVDDTLAGKTRPGAMPEKWDGRAAERIVEVLCRQADPFETEPTDNEYVFSCSNQTG